MTNPDLLADPPPPLDRSPRAGSRDEADLRQACGGLRLAVALGWHGHWDAAHVLAQDHEGEPLFDWLHAVLHRREGDDGNARYWVRRVGLPDPRLVEALTAAVPPTLRPLLSPQGSWSPDAMVTACAEARRSGTHRSELEQLQAVELRALAACSAS